MATWPQQQLVLFFVVWVQGLEFRVITPHETFLQPRKVLWNLCIEVSKQVQATSLVKRVFKPMLASASDAWEP